MAQAIPVLMAVSTAVSVVGQIQQANAAEDAANYNAQIEERKATQAEEQARFDAERRRVAANKAIGALKASAGASGVAFGGSILDVFAESTANADLDVETILAGGANVAGANRDTATLDLTRGKNAKRAGAFNAASTALLGGAQAYDAYLRPA